MSDGLRTLLLYLAAALAYITLGVFLPRFVLSIVEGIVFLLIAVWLIPALVARLRR